MDKNSGVTCVVNKTNTIDTTYRYFKMEVLAGEENMVAKVGEIYRFALFCINDIRMYTHADVFSLFCRSKKMARPMNLTFPACTGTRG